VFSSEEKGGGREWGVKTRFLDQKKKMAKEKKERTVLKLFKGQCSYLASGTKDWVKGKTTQTRRGGKKQRVEKREKKKKKSPLLGNQAGLT